MRWKRNCQPKVSFFPIILVNKSLLPLGSVPSLFFANCSLFFTSPLAMHWLQALGHASVHAHGWSEKREQIAKKRGDTTKGKEGSIKNTNSYSPSKVANAWRNIPLHEKRDVFTGPNNSDRTNLCTGLKSKRTNGKFNSVHSLVLFLLISPLTTLRAFVSK